MLPPPSDINFKIPEISEEEFFNPKGDEDEILLKTGEWGDDSEQGDLLNEGEE